MIQEEFALLGLGQHSFEQFHFWAGILLKSVSSEEEMMVLGQQKGVLSRKVKPS